MAPLYLEKNEPSHFSNFLTLYRVISSGDVPVDDVKKTKQEKKN